jgi:hypothetical protein
MSPDPGPSTEIRLDTRALRCHPTPCQHGDADGVNKLHFVAHPAASLAGVNAFGLAALRALHLHSWASSPHPASNGRSAHTTQNPIDRESHSQIRSIRSLSNPAATAPRSATRRILASSAGGGSELGRLALAGGAHPRRPAVASGHISGWRSGRHAQLAGDVDAGVALGERAGGLQAAAFHHCRSRMPEHPSLGVTAAPLTPGA